MPGLGLRNTLHLRIPNLSTLFLWVDPRDYDRQGNTSLTVNSAAPTGTIYNKAGAGGTATTPSGTGPTVLRSSMGIYSLAQNRTDKRLVFSFSAVSQPILIVTVMRRNNATVGTYGIIDGLSLHRAVIQDLAPTQLQMGVTGFLSAAQSTQTSSYNVLLAEYNNAGTSRLDLNYQFTRTGSYTQTGAAGSIGAQTVTGITLGALNDGSNANDGEIVLAMGWAGTYPTPNQVQDVITRTLSIGAPFAAPLNTTLSRLWFWLYPSTYRIAIKGADLVVFIGDSITAGIPGPSHWMDPLITSINSGLSGLGGSAITTSNKGTSGNTIAQIDTRFNADVIAQSPQACFVQGGINDVFQQTAIDQYVASWRSVVSKWTGSGRAANKLCLVGPLVQNEFFPDPLEITIEQYNNVVATVAYENGCAFADVRSAGQLYESVHNTPPPGAASGVITSDGKHPNSTGCTLMSNTAFALCDLSP